MNADDRDGVNGGRDSYLAGLDGGANVLVVGTAPESLHRRVCRQLCAHDGGPRRRLLVFGGSDAADVDRWLPAGAPRDPEHLRVIDHGVPTRSAAAARGETSPLQSLNPITVTEVPGDELERLGATITETVDEFEAISGGLAPGDLVVCFDSLVALAETRGRSTVFGFLHLLTARLGRTNARSVFHLSVPIDHPTATMFESLFDAVAEVRERGGGQVRIHFEDGDSTQWFPIDDDRLTDG